MSRFRFFLILLLTVALDLSSPLPSHASSQVVEEFEDAFHALRGRRPVRVVRDALPARIAHETAMVERQSRRFVAEPVRRTAPAVLILKQPPKVAESPSAPDAH